MTRYPWPIPLPQFRPFFIWALAVLISAGRFALVSPSKFFHSSYCDHPTGCFSTGAIRARNIHQFPDDLLHSHLELDPLLFHHASFADSDIRCIVGH
jgi:hypothetical protein